MKNIEKMEKVKRYLLGLATTTFLLGLLAWGLGNNKTEAATNKEVASEISVEKEESNEKFEIPMEFDGCWETGSPDGTVEERLSYLMTKAFDETVDLFNEGITSEETFNAQ